MSADYEFKRRSAVQRRVLLKDASGAVINLTGKTVDFIFSRGPGKAPIFDRELTISANDRAAGAATFELLAADTDFVGYAYGEFRITDGTLVEFAPGHTYIVFMFHDGLELES